MLLSSVQIRVSKLWRQGVFGESGINTRPSSKSLVISISRVNVRFDPVQYKVFDGVGVVLTCLLRLVLHLERQLSDVLVSGITKQAYKFSEILEPCLTDCVVLNACDDT